MNTCKDCKWWGENKEYPHFWQDCKYFPHMPVRIRTHDSIKTLNDIYFVTHPDFGCIHHESKDKEDANKD